MNARRIGGCLSKPIFVRHHETGCPTLRDFRRVGASDDGIRDLFGCVLPHSERSGELQEESEIYVRGAHWSNTATSGAAHVVVVCDRSKAFCGPPPASRGRIFRNVLGTRILMRVFKKGKAREGFTGYSFALT